MQKLLFGLLLCVSASAFGMSKNSAFRLPRMFMVSKGSKLVHKLQSSEYRSYAGYVDDNGLVDCPTYHERYVREVICCFATVLDESHTLYDLKKMADDLFACGTDSLDEGKLSAISSQLVSFHEDLQAMSGKINELLKERRDRELLENIHKRRSKKD